MKNNKLLIVDGNNLLYRGYFATSYSGTILRASDGTATNGVYAFGNMLKKAVNDIKPTHLVVVLDKGKHTFRANLSEDYKATRKPAPDDLVPQFGLLRDMLISMNIQYFENEDYEADDFAGSLCERFKNENLDIYILSSDRDMYQLISDKVTVITPKKGVSNMVLMTPSELKSETGLEPYQIIEFKSIAGDSSDNIKGIAGIGEKTAKDLLGRYKTVDEIYNHIDELKGKTKEKFEKGRSDYELSKQLATIKRDIVLNYNISDLKLNINWQTANDFFRKYDMKTLVKE